MKYQNLTEKYNKDHKCKTPGAIYTIEMHDSEVSAKVKLPKGITIPEKDMDDLEAEFHYAVEAILSKYF